MAMGILLVDIRLRFPRKPQKKPGSLWDNFEKSEIFHSASKARGIIYGVEGGFYRKIGNLTGS